MKKKILATVSALILLCQSIPVSVSAANLSAASGTQDVSYDSTDSTADPTTYRTVPLEVVKAETYNVVLPKKIIFDGSGDDATVEYEVKATGEINSTHYVRVIPLGDIVLKNEDESVALDVDVDQTKRRWTSTEVVDGSGSNTTTATVSTDDLEPGTWTGYMRYFVSLDDGGIWSSATCTAPATCLGYDTDDDGVISDSEKLDTVLTKGTALGHIFAEGASTFPGTCTRCNKLVYSISTPEQLVAFSTSVNGGNSYSGANIELNADIDMSGIDFTPIGAKQSTPFNGNFNGNGHTISNLNVVADETLIDTVVAVGMFGWCTSSNTQTFKDLTLLNETISYNYGMNYSGRTRYVAGLVGCTANTSDNGINFINVRETNLTVVVSSTQGQECTLYMAGMLGGHTNGRLTSFSNCSVTGNLAATSSVFKSTVAGYATSVTSTTGSLRMSVYNCLAAVSISTAKAAVNAYTFGVAGGSYNYGYNVYDTDVMTATGSSSDGTGLSTEDCKSAAAVTILNKNNTSYAWTLDLEGINEGYPYVK